MEKQLHRLDQMESGEIYALAMSIVAPRLIAWVSTYNPDGSVNIAPYAMSGVVSVDPLIVQFCSIGKKHTYHNAISRGAFGFNIPSVEHRSLVAETGKPLAAADHKIIPCEIDTYPATLADAPLINTTAASFECAVLETKEMGGSTIVYGQVQAIHTATGLLTEKGTVDFAKLNPLTKLGSIEWGQTTTFV